MVYPADNFNYILEAYVVSTKQLQLSFLLLSGWSSRNGSYWRSFSQLQSVTLLQGLSSSTRFGFWCLQRHHSGDARHLGGPLYEHSNWERTVRRSCASHSPTESVELWVSLFKALRAAHISPLISHHVSNCDLYLQISILIDAEFLIVKDDQPCSYPLQKQFIIKFI